MVDTTDLKSVDRKVVPVRVWQRAPRFPQISRFENSLIRAHYKFSHMRDADLFIDFSRFNTFMGKIFLIYGKNHVIRKSTIFARFKMHFHGLLGNIFYIFFNLFLSL